MSDDANAPGSRGYDEKLSERLTRGPVASALGGALSFLGLNFVLVATSLLVVTAPMAFLAAFKALDGWRCRGEDRVLREFLVNLRSGRFGRVTVTAGVPMVGCLVSLMYVVHFVDGGGIIDRICFGLGLSGVIVATSGLGYVLLLATRKPEWSVKDVWLGAARLTARNGLVTGPVFVAEWVVVGVAGLLDPRLVVVGLPLALLYVLDRTADWGLRRALQAE